MPHINIAAETLFTIAGFPITNALIASWITVGVLVFLILGVRRLQTIPAGMQNVFEVFVEGSLALMEGVLGSREKAEKYLPLVAAIFLFILTSNWIGILPGVGSIEYIAAGAHGAEERLPLLRSAASDLNFTLALGITAVVLVNAAGIRALGARTHLAKYFTFKNPIRAFVGILEFISEFAKIVSFSFRLFGNVFAGEVLLTVAAFVAALLTPAFLSSLQSGFIALTLLPFLALEIFVGFVQALVFAMLTMVFISIAVAHQESH
ncbi:MAG: F0F1 ATP synthase subunit A [Candidatus Sungbacteria bacterium]|nr:F0F1 ATP synthase subunit A [Candidatus Sungbacteria bacterium]